MVGKHGLQTFEVVVVVLLLWLLLFNIFVSTSVHPLLYLDMWFVQIYLNVSCKHIVILEILVLLQNSMEQNISLF